ncbi:MAG: phage integrase N-terminal SAM-like domain-containing protein, partial [bacterium]|nr:phage integrase N-terminal SAM-like domain-containing protein [bacterium]
MNTEKKNLVKKCEGTLKMGGRSEITAKNYCYAVKRFLNYYNNKTNIKTLTIDKLINYFKKNYLDINDMTFKDLYTAFYEYQKDKVRDSTMKTYKDRI